MMSSTHALMTAHCTHLYLLIKSGALVPPTTCVSHSMEVVNNDAGDRLVC